MQILSGQDRDLKGHRQGRLVSVLQWLFQIHIAYLRSVLRYVDETDQYARAFKYLRSCILVDELTVT
jgi:hypothetical protein